ncbi:MAG: hypothetical protein QOD40_758 [Alphaproteobacteria bacterium]|nr:hypothetical protein [Alphaproteobacteria bacterium]
MAEAKIWTVHDLWAKYEDIAMHFNDLLIRLRTQALAAVAALSTLVGIFTKTDPNSVHVSWEVATAVFIGLGVFWTAIWAIDRCYYNRLLIGAVSALKDLEAESTKPQPDLKIDFSTKIEQHVSRPFGDTRPLLERFQSRIGVRAFYFLVFAAICCGAAFCYCHELATRNSPAVAPCSFAVPHG